MGGMLDDAGRKSVQAEIVYNDILFPSKWIDDKWNYEYFISAITTEGSFKIQRIMVMSRGVPCKYKCVELYFQYP